MKRINYEIFTKIDFNISNFIIEKISQHNWTENRECLLELSAIQNGINNFENWAFESNDLILRSISSSSFGRIEIELFQSFQD